MLQTQTNLITNTYRVFGKINNFTFIYKIILYIWETLLFAETSEELDAL